MARHNLKLDELPRVVYTYFTSDGEKRALVINRDLDDMPYWYGAEEALFSPRTPVAVRTLLFNNHIASNKKEAFRPYASHVLMHTTNNGLTFIEVVLTMEGAKFIMSDLRKMQPENKKILYSTLGVAADKLFAAFTPRLQDALAFIGLRPF